MVSTQLHQRLSAESDVRRELELTCMANLLANTDERVYFKDLNSRFLFVSAGWLAAAAPGRTAEEVVGLTDFDIFSQDHATEAMQDEHRIIRTGEPIVGKLERETFGDRAGDWVSTTKMALRDKSGRVIGTFGISRDITAQIEAEKALAYQALHDPVTGLANRAAFMDRLDQAVLDLERRPAALAVLFVDLDHFKDVNDSFGHDAGDHLLAEVGRRLVLLARRADTVGRLGGDEFVVLCRDLGDDDDVGRIGERIVCGLRAPYLEGGRDLSVTASVGIVVATDPRAQPERIVRDADAAMYEAKKAGRDCYRVDDSTRPNARRTNNLRAELRSAIESSELVLVYQPLFALGQRSLLGVEALVRWRHPERGVLLPNDFVPFAERHGLIAGIGSFVLDEACHQLAAWTERPGWPERFTMAVNISARELSDPGFRGRVAEVVRRHGLSPARLCLEVPETALIGEVGHVQETMSALSEMGVRIAVNDFGTGYSLARLRRSSVDILKIDSTFVAQISQNPRDREIVAAVTAMSHALGITVVGGGIETTDQLETLTALDCDGGQGFLFARPMSPNKVASLVGEGAYGTSTVRSPGTAG
jgi:diguanylate cyclase (GGDEF)-like protein/PAS domain S-box-containing protein